MVISKTEESTKTTFVIWKYELQITDFQSFEIPGGAMVVSITKQNEKPIMYVLVDKERKEYSKNVIFEVRVIGTGHGIPYDTNNTFDSIFTYEPMGTLGFLNDGLMFHFFVRKRFPREEYGKN